MKMPSSISIFNSLENAFDGLLNLLDGIDEASFSFNQDQVIGASIGEHIRHVIDHITALYNALESNACVYYDRRKSGDPSENNIQLCRDRLKKEKERTKEIHRLAQKESFSLLKKITLEHTINSQGDNVILHSTLERELMFVFHHLVHHKAIIAIRLRLLKQSIPQGFGVAPSTLSRNE